MKPSIKPWAITMATLMFCSKIVVIADTPQEILASALSNQHPQSFTATVATEDAKGMASLTHTSTFIVPDGTTETRSEIDTTIGKQTFHLIQISNSEGTWFLKGTTAIKADFMTKIDANAQEASKSSINLQGAGTTYSMDELELNGIKCHVITVRVSTEQWNENVQNTTKAMGDIANSPAIIKIISDQVPVVTVYYIGTDDGFVYSTRKFNSNGVNVSDLTYKDVKFGIPLDPNLFKIPQDYKVVIAKTPQELGDFMAGTKG